MAQVDRMAESALIPPAGRCERGVHCSDDAFPGPIRARRRRSRGSLPLGCARVRRHERLQADRFRRLWPVVSRGERSAPPALGLRQRLYALGQGAPGRRLQTGEGGSGRGVAGDTRSGLRPPWPGERRDGRDGGIPDRRSRTARRGGWADRAHPHPRHSQLVRGSGSHPLRRPGIAPGSPDSRAHRLGAVTARRSRRHEALGAASQ